jgi:hypothetical protein
MDVSLTHLLRIDTILPTFQWTSAVYKESFMRLMFVIPSVLLLLNVAFSCTVHATSMAPDAARLSNACLLGQFEPRLIERPRTVLSVLGHGLGVPFSMGNIHPGSGWPVAAAGIAAAGQPGNALAFDGLREVFGGGHFEAGMPTGSIALMGQSLPSISPPSAVPLPAAVWLFASALLGFVAVANRRKV